MSDHGAGHTAHHEFNLKENLGNWFFLLALTLLEVWLAYIHLPPVTMLVTLLGLSGLKAAGIIAIFMHMKFEKLSFVLVVVSLTVLTIALLLIIVPDAYVLQNYRW
ncbi:MAG: cytochrome C oxidase subunit IV family protein [Planctomycetes bacterium]|nr:cytochrome C oxidase subunit IV family protein [Planctomycetota bacterium]